VRGNSGFVMMQDEEYESGEREIGLNKYECRESAGVE
jgi:hypothetical protein